MTNEARFARVALAAWYATGGDPEHDPTDAWNDLCRMLEDEPETFPADCRAALAATRVIYQEVEA